MCLSFVAGIRVLLMNIAVIVTLELALAFIVTMAVPGVPLDTSFSVVSHVFGQ